MTVRSTPVEDMADGHVVKLFRPRDRGEPEREWRALNVQAEFAPGMAPAPLSADLDAAPPAGKMTWLPGDPLAARPVAALHLDALAAALDYL